MTARKPRIIAYTVREGSSWNKWEPTFPANSLLIHAILFSDGAIWDTSTGWRPRSSWYTQLRIRQLRNEWKRSALKATFNV